MPTPTPTLGPGGPASWGDWDCDGGIEQQDVDALTRYLNGQPIVQVEPCPEIGRRVDILEAPYPGGWLWGDVDCSWMVDSTDAEKLASWLAGEGVLQGEPCLDIGTPITLET